MADPSVETDNQGTDEVCYGTTQPSCTDGSTSEEDDTARGARRRCGSGGDAGNRKALRAESAIGGDPYAMGRCTLEGAAQWQILYSRVSQEEKQAIPNGVGSGMLLFRVGETNVLGAPAPILAGEEPQWRTCVWAH